MKDSKTMKDPKTMKDKIASIIPLGNTPKKMSSYQRILEEETAQVQETFKNLGHELQLDGPLTEDLKKELQKLAAIKDLVRKWKVGILCIQETKHNDLNIRHIRQVWGRNKVDFRFSPSEGLSGGLLTVWNPDVFQLESEIVTTWGLGLQGRYRDERWLILNLYGKNSSQGKKDQWNWISSLLETWDDPFLAIGDFNVALDTTERRGSTFHPDEARDFSDFLEQNHLQDLPLEAGKFTWKNRDGTKLSRIDRAIIRLPSENSETISYHLTGLPWTVADHRPLLLSRQSVDFGPHPFKFFNAWLANSSFVDFVKRKWDEFPKNDNPMRNFKDKLKGLKLALKPWIATNLEANRSKIFSLKQSMAQLEGIMESRELTLEEKLAYAAASQESSELQRREIGMKRQQLKIKWMADGDENTRLFH
ncbi:hypothetical protein M569_02309, partial [Genlisea aurea]